MADRPLDQSDLTGLPQLDERAIQLLWHYDWWDGPLRGLARYQGRDTWFDLHHEDDDAAHYFYVLYDLTEDQLREARLWHDTHGLWDAERSEWVGRDEELHDAGWPGPDFAGRRPIGWFMDGQNPKFYGIEVKSGHQAD